MGEADRSLLIAGCGYVGLRLAELAAAAGWRVQAGRRRPEALRDAWGGTLPPGVEVRALDLLDPDSVGAALSDAPDAIVYGAGPGAPSEDAYRRVYVEGLGVLLQALESRRLAPRVVFISSTAVYGQSRGEWIDEESPTRPRRWNGSILLEAEARLRAAPVAGSVLRLGGIYGPGRTRLSERVLRGEARLQPGPPHFGNRIHREDAAAAALHLLSQRALAPVALGVDLEPADESDVLRFLARELGVPEPPMAAAGEPPPGRRAGSKRCRPRRLVESGFVHSYPSYREGYRALLRARAEANG